MREHETGHAIGERGFADAALAADQPGVRHATGTIGVEQRLLGIGVTEQDGSLARMRDFGVFGFCGGCAHVAAPSRCVALVGSKRSLTLLQICSATSASGAV